MTTKDIDKDFGNLTIYGRKPVLEALQDNSISVLRLHLSRSNKSNGGTDALRSLARQRDVPVSLHSKMELSRISRNGRQDQGVAADLRCPSLLESVQLIENTTVRHLLAVDRINNPQNLGMIIRSIAASNCDGLLLSREAGNTRLSPLVVKASTGAFFKAPIYSCQQLAPCLAQLQEQGFQIITLVADAPQSLFDLTLPQRCIFVLGNESHGIRPEIEAMADHQVAIPMQRGIESLNVAVTAALLAFLPQLQGPAPVA